MLNGDTQYCDTCAEPIPRGSTYRSGCTTPEAVARWFDDDPRLAPSFTQEPDGTVRIDVCGHCAAQSRSILAHSQPVVDPLR